VAAGGWLPAVGFALVVLERLWLLGEFEEVAGDVE
jgi:hypothetical protein